MIVHCSRLTQTMKFEDLLMQGSEEQHKRHDLEEEVVKLQAELDDEQALNKALQCALHGPVLSNPCLSPLLPPQVRVLLAELAMVEDEILWLEKKVEGLKMRLYHERKQIEEWQMQQSLQQQRRLWQQNHLPRGSGSRSLLTNDIQQRSRSQNYELRKANLKSCRRASFGSAAEILSMSSIGSIEEIHERSSRHASRIRNQCQIIKESGKEKPNAISEELIKCLTSIFLHGKDLIQL